MALTGAGYVPLGQAAAKLGKDAPWDEQQHPRWPAGAEEGRGGRFAPADAGSSEPRQQLALAGVLIDKRYDEVAGITHCTYRTPFEVFVTEHDGYYQCKPTYRAP